MGNLVDEMLCGWGWDLGHEGVRRIREWCWWLDEEGRSLLVSWQAEEFDEPLDLWDRFAVELPSVVQGGTAKSWVVWHLVLDAHAQDFESGVANLRPDWRSDDSQESFLAVAPDCVSDYS